MWSGPRNISTAMMRSFSSRADCAVADEPFYGAYLKATGFDHPMAEAIIADMDCDWQSVARTMNGDPADGSAIWYQKHMPSEMVGPVGIHDLSAHRHAFLIRDPERMIASYAKKMEVVSFEDMGSARPCAPCRRRRGYPRCTWPDAGKTVRGVGHSMGPRHVALGSRTPGHGRRMGTALVWPGRTKHGFRRR